MVLQHWALSVSPTAADALASEPPCFECEPDSRGRPGPIYPHCFYSRTVGAAIYRRMWARSLRCGVISISSLSNVVLPINFLFAICECEPDSQGRPGPIYRHCSYSRKVGAVIYRRMGALTTLQRLIYRRSINCRAANQLSICDCEPDIRGRHCPIYRHCICSRTLGAVIYRRMDVAAF